VAQGVPVRSRPRIILTFRHFKGGRSSAKRTGRLYPRRNPWYSLSETESTSEHMVLSGVPRKNPQRHHRESIPGPSDLTTTLPQAPYKDQVTHKFHNQIVAQCWVFFFVVLLYRCFPKCSSLVAVTIRQ